MEFIIIKIVKKYIKEIILKEKKKDKAHILMHSEINL